MHTHTKKEVSSTRETQLYIGLWKVPNTAYFLFLKDCDQISIALHFNIFVPVFERAFSNADFRV